MLHYYLFTIILGWKVFLHPFYVSLTDIRYNESNQTLEISQRIFYDDLEVALSDFAQTKVDFLNPDNPENLNKLIGAYLLRHNKININGKEIKLHYLGYEIEEDAAWFYLESEKTSIPKTAGISNTILLNQFDDQQNIVNFYMNKKPKSLLLYKGNEKGQLDF